MNLLSSGIGILIAGIALWGTVQEVGSRPHPGPDTSRASQMMGLEADASASVSVRGQVLDATGRPVANVTVLARPQGAAWAYERELWCERDATVTDALGNFVLPDLAPGAYAVVALHADHPPGLAQVMITQPLPGHRDAVRIVLDATELIIPA